MLIFAIKIIGIDFIDFFWDGTRIQKCYPKCHPRLLSIAEVIDIIVYSYIWDSRDSTFSILQNITQYLPK